MNEVTYLSKEKLEELTNELTELKTVKRKEVAQNLEYAKSLGDLSENAEYQEAREMQANIEERILKLENLLKNAQIMSERHEDTVGMGSIVIVQKDSSKDNQKYMIVGSEEADMFSGKLSNESPLGKSLMGKKKGDTFSFKAPSGNVNYKIIDIE